MLFYAVAISILILVYCYAVYPIAIALLARIIPTKRRIDETFEPTVTVILPVHNEEVVLERCLNSLADQEYPASKLEVLVGSDGSIDRSNEIIAKIASRSEVIRPLYFTERRGKMLTVNDLVSRAKGQILLFIDADVKVTTDLIRKHVRHYADPEVGAVAGDLVFAGDDENPVFDTERTYWSYEAALRRNEATIHTTVGLYGGNYTIRREYWRDLPSSVLSDDFLVILEMLVRKARIVYDCDAVCLEFYGRSMLDEFRRKSRNCAAALYSLTYHPGLLSPTSFRAFMMLWPHKVLRWATPLLGSLIFALSVIQLFIAPATWAVAIVTLGAAFLALCGIGMLLDKAGKSLPVFRHAYWIGAMNLAFVYGISKFLLGKERAIWNQTTRVADATLAHDTTIPAA